MTWRGTGHVIPRAARILHWALASFAVLLLAWTASAQAPNPPAIDEIVARHVAARGGYDKLKSMHSLRTVGTLTLGSRGQARLQREIKRPNMVRTDFVLGDVTLVHAFDGKTGWQTDGSGQSTAITGDDLRNAQEDADIEGPLVDYKRKGNRVEMAGTSTINDAPCYNLKVTFPNGDVIFECVDAQSYLVVGQRLERNGVVEVEAVLGNYRDYQGIKLAGTSDIHQAGNPEPVHYKLEKAEINPVIDDSRFRMPAKP